MGAEHDRRRDTQVASTHDEDAEQSYERPQRVAAGLVPVTGLAVPVERTADPLGGSAVDARTARRLTNPSGGRPLETAVRHRMEAAFDADFGAVRVHDDNQAAELASGVQSRAFTHGPDIYFSGGSFHPNTASGEHLLAHELTHVAQQQHGRDAGGGAGIVIGRADDPLEAEADEVAGRVVRTLQQRAQSQRGGGGPG